MAYMGFQKLESSIAARGGVRNPGAVAAAIGRKKYGKSAFQSAAAKGKSMRGMTPKSRALRGRAHAASARSDEPGGQFGAGMSMDTSAGSTAMPHGKMRGFPGGHTVD